MRWQRSRKSTNVQDRRGVRAGPAMAGGGAGTIIALVAAMLGADPRVVLEGGSALAPPATGPGEALPPGHGVPESFTHGTSGQRVRGSRTGPGTGDPERCDTFRSGAL